MPESTTRSSNTARDVRPTTLAERNADDHKRSIHYFVDMDDDGVPTVSLASVFDETEIASYPPSLRTAQAILELKYRNSTANFANLTLDQLKPRVERFINKEYPHRGTGEQIWVPMDEETYDDVMDLDGCDAREVEEIVGSEAEG